MNHQDRREHLVALLDALDQRGEEPAIIAFRPDGVQQLASDQLAEQVRRLSCGLRRRGLSEGDHGSKQRRKQPPKPLLKHRRLRSLLPLFRVNPPGVS